MTISIFNQKHKETLGNAPGTLIYTGGDKNFDAYVESVFFNKEEVSVKKKTNSTDWQIDDRKNFLEWVNVVGLHDEKLFSKIATAFNIDHLWSEDILNINQYPKLETTADSFFVTLKMLRFDEKSKKIISEQLSLVVYQGALLSFQENPGDVFDNVRQRLQNEIYRIRKRGTDYLAYALLDAVVDNYFLVVEQFGNAIEVLEESILSKSKDKNMLDKVYTHKREINFLRRQLRPVMEIIHGFEKAEVNFLKKSTMPYFSDLKDHINQTIDSIELYHTLLNDLLSLHDAQNNQKLNETMKVLTIFSVVFIPLTFLAGIYGTNFEFLPELKYEWAYPAFWGVQISIAVTMLLYFKKKDWL
tara:strand:- start:44136 stop:45209 length:1074 start_codon:yes stop_codon:yes gene_type:complete